MPGLTAERPIRILAPLLWRPPSGETVAKLFTPMARPGTPEEMAYGCLYLGSDEASYCNGTVLTIDGGTTARQ